MARPELSRIKAIVSEALELTGRDREAFVDQACENDAELRAEVQSYLRAWDAAGDVLGAPSATFPDVAATMGDDRQAEELILPPLGTTIGDYTLRELIGEGGFGSVYLAEQLQPVRRQVALKIIKPGMDTRRVIRRFAAERQTLAIMDHPNIARVFDAGATSAGRPYFVMELVRGVPITEYCDANRLTINQRLELFVIVCNAIQHAHNKGVIHRDIKPSNVLVTIHDGQAVPKVIDFGIAKATDARPEGVTRLTDVHQFIGTSGYMAPEQSGNGLDVDTRADIYSLGVLLYVLLTGAKPFDDDKSGSPGAAESQRIARKIDPPKPSTRLSTLGDKFARVAACRNAAPYKLKQLIRGELDWIVMKAIESERARRYETASDLARDVRLHLANKPIEAGPPTTGYRLRKFVRRNRAVVLTTAAFGLTVAVATGVYIHGIRSEQARTEAALREAQHQRTHADERRIEAQQATVRAQSAEAKANEELVFAAVSNARAARAGTRSGRRFDSLKLLNDAVKINPSAEVRDEITACLATADMRMTAQWKTADHGITFDHACKHFAVCTAANQVVIRAIPDAAHPEGALTIQLPGQARIDAAHGQGAHVVFSPDDQQVAVACDDLHVRVYSLDAKVVFDVEDATACDFSPDGKSLATSVLNGTVYIHNLKTGEKLSPARWPGTDAIAYSPNGNRVAMWNVGRQTDVCLGEISTGYFNRCSHEAKVQAVAWRRDARYIATAVDDRGILIWNVGDGLPELVQTMPGQTASVVSLSFTHKGRFIASSSEDGAVHLWDPSANVELVRVMCTGFLCFRGDDRLLGVAATDGRHTLIEVADGLDGHTMLLPEIRHEPLVPDHRRGVSQP